MSHPIPTTRIVPVAERELKNRPSFRETVKHTMTMAYRTLLLIRRTPQQLFDVTVQPIIFTLLFTFLFGGAVSGSWQNYLPIIIPGILVQTVITACMATGIQLREDMDKGVFNRFKSLPIARISPLTGAAVDRYASLWHRHRPDVPDGLSPRLSLGHPRRRRARGHPRHPGGVVHQLDICIPRHYCSFGLVRTGGLHPRHVPSGLSLRGLCAHHHTSRLPSGVRQHQPNDLCRERHPRAVQPGHDRQ